VFALVWVLKALFGTSRRLFGNRGDSIMDPERAPLVGNGS
jgi:hypothetical protein